MTFEASRLTYPISKGTKSMGKWAYSFPLIKNDKKSMQHAQQCQWHLRAM